MPAKRKITAKNKPASKTSKTPAKKDAAKPTKPAPSSSTRASHAARQAQYHAAKTKTHVRICTWVPRDEADDFRKVIAKYHKKNGRS